MKICIYKKYMQQNKQKQQLHCPSNDDFMNSDIFKLLRIFDYALFLHLFRYV
jgi:hypothetical protein